MRTTHNNQNIHLTILQDDQNCYDYGKNVSTTNVIITAHEPTTTTTI